jgi:CRP/FNR family cyclic AMP-dependent transcriptional regulator
MRSIPPASVRPDPRVDMSPERSVFTKRLAPDARDRFLALLHNAAFPAGDQILREGSPTPFLGLVTRGRVALRLEVPGRGPTTILTIEPGELLGWSALVPPYRSTATAVALTATEIALVEAEAFQVALAADPLLAAAILPSVLEAVGARLGESWSQLLDLFGARTGEPW